MKKLCNASAIAAFLTAVCFTAVSCNKTPSESTLPVEKELGVSIELTSATETSVSVDITAEKDAEGYIYAIGEAGKLNEFQNGTMEGIQTQNDPTVKSASFDGLTKATDYTIYAQAFAGEEKGNVRQLVVTTEGEPDFDLTTTTTIDNITEDSFVIRVEFGADTRTLVYGYGSADDLEAFENGTLSTITKVTNPTANTIIVRGMERGQEYTVFVQAVAGDKKGNVSTVSGKTLKLELELVLLEDELTSTSAVVEIRPGGDTSKYRYMLGSMEQLDYFENGTWPDIMWENDVTAPKETQATGLTPGKTYTIFAQPFAENGTRGETQIIEFTTPTADEAE